MKKENIEKPIFRNAGDTGLIVEFGKKIDPDINNRVRAMQRALKKQTIKGIKEIIPSYTSLLLIYDPLQTDFQNLINLIEDIEKNLDTSQIVPGEVVKIPVCYGDDLGPDIENVEKSSGLSRDEVIKLHCEPEYLIYMIGFTPGFPFLGGLNEKLFTPRLKTPRVSVPKGSVGIANNQTGMYPIASPGGWQLIGQTPLNLFALHRKNPFLYKAGDRIKFIPVSKKEFKRLKDMEAAR